MMSKSPRVDVGLPVKNGENYLEEAIRSLTNQSFEDFRLMIADNASTDGTEEICREAEATDSRVVYVRHETDLGASANYGFVFEHSSAPLFRWANHDDMWAPEHLAKSVEAIEDDPRAILAFTGALDIGADGAPIHEWPLIPGYGSTDPSVRMEEAVTQEETFPIFGLIRRPVLAKTRLQPPYAGSDRGLLVHLSLLGGFAQVEEPLFFHRQHPERSIRSARNRRERMNWWDPAGMDRFVAPHLSLTRDYLRAIAHAPLTASDRRRCVLVLLRDVIRRRRALVVDVAGAINYWLRGKLPLRL